MVERRLRQLQLGIAGFGFLGLVVELVIEEHYVVPIQLLAFFLCGIGAVSVIALLVWVIGDAMKPENRERFKADERAYLDEWAMTEEQKQGVLDRDLNRLISLGGNIYFLAKIGATDGRSFQQMAGSMTGMSEDEYRQMMVEGGRSPDGNRYLAEWENHES